MTIPEFKIKKTMKTLNEIMNSNGSDKGDSIGVKHNYVPIYEQWFENCRDKEIKFVEIGIDFAQSLKGWTEYFQNGKIFMIDINDFSQYNSSRVTCIRGNQSIRFDMNKASEIIGENIDYLIDDGGHCMDHHQFTFAELFPKMKSGGFYFIEDIHTANWDPKKDPSSSPGFCYGQPLHINEDRSSSTINVFKNFQKNGSLDSPFLTLEDNKRLTSMIDEVIIYDDNNNIIDVESSDELNITLNGVILIKKK